MTITTLIDKQDNFEIIRDKIAQILADETYSQQTLAHSVDLDPQDWKLRVFTERSTPWEQFLDPDQVNFNDSPIVNVWFDSASYDMDASNIIERQKTIGIFNIDCYGYGRSADKAIGGHIAGDEDAAIAVQRALRLVRNILMAATYTYLDLRGLVWQRWVQSTNVFQPQLDGRQVQQIVGARLILRVQFNEFSPQIETVTLESVVIDILRKETGEIIAQAQYDYPLDP